MSGVRDIRRGPGGGVGSWAPLLGGRQERTLEVEAERLRAIRRSGRQPVPDALGELDELRPAASTRPTAGTT